METQSKLYSPVPSSALGPRRIQLLLLHSSAPVRLSIASAPATAHPGSIKRLASSAMMMMMMMTTTTTTIMMMMMVVLMMMMMLMLVLIVLVMMMVMMLVMVAVVVVMVMVLVMVVVMVVVVMLMVMMGKRSPILYITTPDQPPLRLLLVSLIIND